MEVAGYRIGAPRDCESLSDDILKRTGRSISTTTLRRFFGLLKSSSDLSRFNLDTLAIFTGYADYHDFIAQCSGEMQSDRPGASRVLLELEQITDYTLNSVIHKCLSPFRKTIARERLEEMLMAFMDSGKMIMPLIAPGGYGKSVALAHWIREVSTRESSSFHPLFCSASIFYKLLQPAHQQTGCITLDPLDPGNIFRQFEYNKQVYRKPLLLIIDGIDEIESEVTKVLKLVAAIFDIAGKYRRGGMVRIVLSMRVVFWQKFILPELRAEKPDWFMYSGMDGLNQNSVNMPVLSGTELRELLRAEQDRKGHPVIYDCIHWELKQLIRIPINLHFFLSVSGSLSSSLVSSDVLLKQYLDALVFNSRFGEEKSDLIWYLVREHMNSGPRIPKSRVKENYPIHLKREANYYQAYNRMLSDGILQEERLENSYGLYVTYIRFSHPTIHYYLNALYFVRMNNGYSGTILERIAGQNQSLDWKVNLVAYIFQMAYAREEYEALKDLCDIDREIISSLPVRQAVGNAFRGSNRIRDRLVDRYASHPAGQEQFFEMYVDTNYLINHFSSSIKMYLKHKETTEARMFGHGILFLAEFLSLNRRGCEMQMEILNGLEPDASVHPWPIGRKVSSMLLYSHIVKGSATNKTESYINEYTKLAYMYPGYLERGAIEFEMMILLALTLAGKCEWVVRIGDTISRNYNLSPESQAGLLWRHQYQNAFARAYIDYAGYRSTGQIAGEVIQGWESLLDSYESVFDDFQNMIMVHYFLFDYYLTTGQEERTRYHLESALAISRFAKYSFYEAFLLSKAAILDPAYKDRANDLIRISGYTKNAACFN